MSETLIFGHKKPDTDSCISAIALSYLKNKLGDNTSPRVLGRINNETKYVLDYFNIKTPKYLNDVKLQIKDVNYLKDCYINENNSIYKCYKYLQDKKINSVPIVNDNKKISGIVSNNDILNKVIDEKYNDIDTNYDNILETLSAEEVLRFNDNIKGEVISTAFRSTTFVEEIMLTNDSILIVGNRHSIIEYAIKNNIKMLILVSDTNIKEEHLEQAKNHKINIIKTSLNSIEVSKYISLSNFVKTIAKERKELYTYTKEYYNDFLDRHSKIKNDSYPVLNKNDECVGLLTINNIYNYTKKKVVLVDHNENIQSVDGIEEADTIEVVDHHKLGNFSTASAIDIKTIPVGSTATIIYQMFLENKVEIPKDIAGILMSAILSDTLLFKSPTTTYMDRIAVSDLEKNCGVDHEKFGIEMIKNGASLNGKSKEEILYSDFKGFVIDDKKVGIGQINTLDYSIISKDAKEYVELLNEISKNENYYILALFVTDIIKGGSYILYNDNSKFELEKAFDIEKLEEEHFLNDVISRKKQIIPKIVEKLEKGR